MWAKGEREEARTVCGLLLHQIESVAELFRAVCRQGRGASDSMIRRRRPLRRRPREGYNTGGPKFTEMKSNWSLAAASKVRRPGELGHPAEIPVGAVYLCRQPPSRSSPLEHPCRTSIAARSRKPQTPPRMVDWCAHRLMSDWMSRRSSSAALVLDSPSMVRQEGRILRSASRALE